MSLVRNRERVLHAKSCISAALLCALVEFTFCRPAPSILIQQLPLI